MRTPQKSTNALPEAVMRSAQNWVLRHLIEQKRELSFENIRAALEAYAHTVTGNTFVRMRNDLVRYFAELLKDYPEVKNLPSKIRRIANPVPVGQRKPKRRKRKGCTQAEFDALMQDAVARDDQDLIAALWAVRATGARPAELHRISLVDGWRQGPLVKILGAKQADIHGEARGMEERLLMIEDKELLGQLIFRVGRLNNLKDLRLNRLQQRLRRAGKRLWPQRKIRPTLYSLRHQLGSDLKASELSDAQRAAVMGHLSQSSIESYGYTRSGKGRAIQPTEQTVNRVKPKPPRSQTIHNRNPPGQQDKDRSLRR
jgi:hypothetical protein